MRTVGDVGTRVAITITKIDLATSIARRRTGKEATRHNRIKDSKYRTTDRLHGWISAGRNCECDTTDHASGAIGVAHRRDKMSDGRDIIALLPNVKTASSSAARTGSARSRSISTSSASTPRSRAPLSAALRHDLVVRRRRDRDAVARSTSTTASSTIPTTTAATPCSASTSRCTIWSTRSRARPPATASRSACCCCTAPSAAARARSPGC